MRYFGIISSSLRIVQVLRKDFFIKRRFFIVDIITFIVDNLELLIAAIFAIVSFISSVLGIINKLKNKKSERLSELLRNLPEIISISETIFPNLGKKTGAQKQFAVLSYIESFCGLYNLPFDKDYWLSQIEAVLSAPQKKYIKEVSDETKKDSKKG